jgi:hypothetical protein
MGAGGAGGDPNFASFPVPPGDYKVALVVDGKTLTTKATVLKDPRY